MRLRGAQAPGWAICPLSSERQPPTRPALGALMDQEEEEKEEEEVGEEEEEQTMASGLEAPCLHRSEELEPLLLLGRFQSKAMVWMAIRVGVRVEVQVMTAEAMEAEDSKARGAVLRRSARCK
jgi:hypothetical protein